MVTPECPHCGKKIELYEPTDLDKIGLTQNPRGVAIKEGLLPVWASLRSGKFFLFQKKDVDAFNESRRTKVRRKMFRQSNGAEAEGLLTDDEINDFFDMIEKRIETAKRRKATA